MNKIEKHWKLFENVSYAIILSWFIELHVSSGHIKICSNWNCSHLNIGCGRVTDHYAQGFMGSHVM